MGTNLEHLNDLLIEALKVANDFIVIGEFDVSKSYCNQILKIDEKNDEAWFLLGICLSNLNKKNEAKEAFLNAIKYTELEENKNFVRSKLESI